MPRSLRRRARPTGRLAAKNISAQLPGLSPVTAGSRAGQPQAAGQPSSGPNRTSRQSPMSFDPDRSPPDDQTARQVKAFLTWSPKGNFQGCLTVYCLHDRPGRSRPCRFLNASVPCSPAPGPTRDHHRDGVKCRGDTGDGQCCQAEVTSTTTRLCRCRA